MKNKKLVLIATAAMGVVALGTAGVGTAAWFQASSAATLTDKSAAGTVTVSSSTFAAGTYYMKATATLDNANIDYTDNTGACWVIVNGKLRAATPKYATYRTVTVSLAFYSNEACTTPCTAVELTEIGATFDYVTISLDVGANTRLVSQNPATASGSTASQKFVSAFITTPSLGVDRTVTATITQATGAVSYNTATWYVSVNGDGNSEAASAHADGDDAPAEYTTTGSIGVSAVAHTR